MDPEASISTEPIVGGISYDEMDLQYVVGTPMLTSSFAMVEGTPATVVGTTSPYALMGQYTYVDFVARNFRYISGSYKFKAYITASQMHSVRVVFFLSILGTSDWQDCYHRVVDIQGDTEAEFTMPYCNTEVVREINSETVYFKIWVKILAWSQPTPAVSNPIWMNVYKSGASDFRVGGMKEQEFTTTSNPRQDFAQVFEPMHPSVVGYVPDNIVYPEEFTSIRDIVHRDTPYVAVTNNKTPVYQCQGVSATKYIGLELWGLIYMFHRGSVRTRYLRKNTTVAALMCEYNVDTTFVPGLDIGFTDKPMIAAEIPWYTSKLFVSNSTFDTNHRKNTYLSTNTGAFYCSAAGDDFSFHFLRPPPNGTLSYPDPERGYKGLATFLST